MRNVQVQADWNRANGFGIRGIFAFFRALVAGILLCLSVSAGAQASAKKVLVIYSFADRQDFSAFNDLRSGLQGALPWPIDFYGEILEGQRLDDEDYDKDLAENLRNKYGKVRLDLVIVEKEPALRFAIRHRDRLFPGVPIAFFDLETQLREEEMLPGVTGVTATFDVQSVVDLAIRLRQNTSAVAVIIGASPYERYWLQEIHSALLRHQGQVKEIDLVALPADELSEKVAALPPQTAVFFQMDRQELSQPAFGTNDMVKTIGARFPVYCIPPWLCLNHGGVGGDAYDGYRQIALLAGPVRRILSGEPVTDIPVVHDTQHNLVVDWRELRHWNIPESALPSGSEIRYREPTLWERDRKYIIAAASVIAALLLLIAGLLWQRARKRKAEALLRESEKRFRVMAESTPTLVWMCDPQGKITYLNERRIAFTGPGPNAGYGDSWMEYVHPDDRRNVQDVFFEALKDRRPFSNEYRLRRIDGAYRWMFDVASPRLNGDGSFAGFIGSAIDVTDQKMAQQALEKVSGQLIEAQENERRRIARDLHDDICQRLALLSMELDQANRSANESGEVTKQRLKEIRQHCSEIAGDVQSLSHELHSSRLDYLGIEAAIRGFCHEFSKQHEVSIEFTERDVPADLPRDVSLCLFRVAQEALHNAVKYSGVTRYSVELRATAKEIQLLVSDAGKGFDVEAVNGNRGLGLVSMQERVHLVHGSLHVESEPGQGTKILAVVPLVSERRGSPEEEPEGVAG